MALQRVVIDGYGQLELNAVAFRRSGRIEAQCALDATDFKEVPAENGMLLAVDNVNRVVKFVKSGNVYPIALNYTTEHMYDERHNALKDFKLELGEFYPRMGYIGAGDKYTTNTVCYDESKYATEALFLAALGTKPMYAHAHTDGYHLVNETAEGAIALAVAATTMPDGQNAVKFVAL